MSNPASTAEAAPGVGQSRGVAVLILSQPRPYVGRAAASRPSRVVTSAAFLAESLRRSPGDAAAYRVLRKVAVEPVSQAIAEQAGRLTGSAGLGSGQAVDAIVVATALAEPGPVVIATSDLGDLTALVGNEDRIAADKL